MTFPYTDLGYPVVHTQPTWVQGSSHSSNYNPSCFHEFFARSSLFVSGVATFSVEMFLKVQ